jgi:YegS/Rv2252/BmrU family lipid kinase
MTSVAVIAHEKKELEGGLPELRRILYEEGVTDPWWREVSKSKQVPKSARAALDDGADLIFVWGGDGTVQQCVNAVAGSGVAIAILPAGTANLLATNLDVPKDIRAAVRVGLHGARRPLDLGLINGERFAVMAGVGFDALMIRDAGAGMKDRLGRFAYVVTGAKHLSMKPVHARIRVDGRRWHKGKTSCVLFGNVGKLLGAITAFSEAKPDDGWLEVGVVTGRGLAQWIRIAGRTAMRKPEKSPFVRTTRGRSFDIRLDRKMPYELDGSDRKASKRFRVEIEPDAITVCVPEGKVA